MQSESLHLATQPSNRPKEMDEILGVPLRWSLGWHLGFNGKGSSLRTFGHGGAWGQVGFADPDRQLALAFLCNGPRSPRFLR